MATLREWLKDLKFDWNTGTIIYHDNNEFKTQYADGCYIESKHPILKKEFWEGFGSAEAPAIFARDKDAIYIICKYDGSTWMEKIYLEEGYYLKRRVPYVGGGR